MIRALLLALLVGAGGASAQEFRADPAWPRRGAAAARGALVWLHPYEREATPPPAPEWVAGLVAQGWDVWRLDRAGGPDPLDAGAATLAEGSEGLRAMGYRQVALLGESRGAFIGLVALRYPRIADAAVFAAPAAHGRRPERRPQALADFAAALDAAAQPAPRLGLFLFEGDGWDPDPAARAAIFRSATARLGVPGLLVDRPAAPQGHGGLQEPEFAARFAGCVAAFLDVTQAPPETCP